MAYTIPTTEPTELRAGDSWKWDKHLSAYPPSEGWALTYYLHGPAEVTELAAAASSEGDYHEVRATPEVTEAYTRGTYTWLARVSDGTDSYTVGTGTVTILPNLATASSARSHAETALAAIDAALEGRLTADTEGFQIAGRAVNQIPIRDLKRLQGIYRAQVWRERNAGKFAPDVEVEFVQPG